jgi:hypothetical protein
VLLTGIDINGQAVNRSTQVDAHDFYQLTGLRPGTYTLKVNAAGTPQRQPGRAIGRDVRRDVQPEHDQ